jgi:hypothetical protein
MTGTSYLFLLWFLQVAHLLAFLWPSLLSSVHGSSHWGFFIGFVVFICFLFMCETRTEITLIYFLKLEPEVLYKSKEPPIASNIIGSAG